MYLQENPKKTREIVGEVSSMIMGCDINKLLYPTLSARPLTPNLLPVPSHLSALQFLWSPDHSDGRPE